MTTPAHNLIAEAAERIGRPRVSFEFFPPKTEALETQLWEAIRKLEPLQPSFVSVTYGAGGSTRDRTHRTVSRIVGETTLKPAAHLTCVAAGRDEINMVLDAYWAPASATSWRCAAIRLAAWALRMSRTLKASPTPLNSWKAPGSRHDFEVSVAVHPERHPNSPSWQVETRKLQAQARRRRHARHFAVLLRRRRVPALSRPSDAGGHPRAGGAGHHAGDELQRAAEDGRRLQRQHPDMARQFVRWHRQRSGNTPPRRCGDHR